MNARGFTLVEVVVALLLLEVAVLGVVGTLVLARRTLTEAEALERAVTGVERVVDSLMASGPMVEGEDAHAWGRVTWVSLSDGLGADTSGAWLVTATGVRGDTLVHIRAGAP